LQTIVMVRLIREWQWSFRIFQMTVKYLWRLEHQHQVL
jgi:hypothetical protein